MPTYRVSRAVTQWYNETVIVAAESRDTALRIAADLDVEWEMDSEFEEYSDDPDEVEEVVEGDLR